MTFRLNSHGADGADGGLGRREANKVRTRESLWRAANELLYAGGFESLTAEKIADAAGISRRTFFNYFPSVEALFAAQTQGVLEGVQRALAGRPMGEDILVSAQAVIPELFDRATLDDAARGWRVMDANPAVNRFVLEANAEMVTGLASTWAVDRLRAQGRDADPLRVHVLSAAIIAAFDVARRQWLGHHPHTIDEAAREDFVARVGQALDYLRPAVDAA